jgi:peptidoglycan/xylan/chitin deacetylase (PgdA/CDA1 family)
MERPGAIIAAVLPLLLTLLVPVLAQDSLEVAGDTFDLTDRTVVLSIDDGYHSVYTNIYPLLKRYRMPATLALIGGCVGSGRPSYRPTERFLNRSEIKEMTDSCGIEIASHTMTHAWLTRIDSAAAWHEINYSKSYLESLFGVPVETFVYPYGDMNERVRRLVVSAGYRMARAVRPGTPDFGRDPFRIPEVELRKDRKLASVLRHIETNRTTVILLHRIVPAPKVYTEWSLTDFASLLDWLRRHGVRVTTLARLHDEWWRLRLARDLVEELERTRPRTEWLFQQVDVDATGAAHTR